MAEPHKAAPTLAEVKDRLSLTRGVPGDDYGNLQLNPLLLMIKPGKTSPSLERWYGLYRA